MIENSFDTETTGLILPMGTNLKLQPHIIEIAVIKFDPELLLRNGRKAVVSTLIKPLVPIPYHITKINGIDDYMVANSPTFAEVYPSIRDIFENCDISIGHNLIFDEGMISLECQRLGLSDDFLFKPFRFCTVEQSMHLKGYRLKNDELYKLATGKEISNSHRAKADALATYESYKWLNNG